MILETLRVQRLPRATGIGFFFLADPLVELPGRLPLIFALLIGIFFLVAALVSNFDVELTTIKVHGKRLE